MGRDAGTGNWKFVVKDRDRWKRLFKKNKTYLGAVMPMMARGIV